MPERIQLSRKKGWRMPPNTVSVARPGKFGNPFTVYGCIDAGYIGTHDQLAERCVAAFRSWLGPHWREHWQGKESERRRSALLAALPDLRGKNLACWCKLDQPCHANILLELANTADDKP